MPKGSTWASWEAIGAGVFCPIGEGCVDFVAVAEALDAVGYDGAATVEQDRAPGDAASALDQLHASIAHLTKAFAASGREGSG
jgi:inosose dehydratase